MLKTCTIIATMTRSDSRWAWFDSWVQCVQSLVEPASSIERSWSLVQLALNASVGEQISTIRDNKI
jgi:hypothetical protein